MDKGIIIACDEKLEWMLRWFWGHLKTHCRLPVAIVDFGLSPPAKAWCKEAGILIPFSAPKINLGNIKPEWQRAYGGNCEEGRAQRLFKPFALHLTPFSHSLWLDLDCEVLAPLDELFDYEFALADERRASYERLHSLNLLKEGDKLYNSGVIAYKKGTSILTKWCEETLQKGCDFIGDQELLSEMLNREAISIDPLPAKYNWRIADGENPDAHIIHWVGHGGKRRILERLLLSSHKK